MFIYVKYVGTIILFKLWYKQRNFMNKLKFILLRIIENIDFRSYQNGFCYKLLLVWVNYSGN